MKAISLWQPWATAIALGSKRIETRSWRTDYRGPLAIHAAKRCESDILHLPWWKGALERCGSGKLEDVLPRGAIVAICRLVDCKPTEEFSDEKLDAVHGIPPCFTWTERQMGDFSPDRFGRVLEDIHQLREPIPFRGKQGFFNITLRTKEWFLAGKTAIKRT